MEAVERAVERVSVPADITEKHINISVYRQEDMWEFVKDTIDNQGPHRLIPAHPLSGDAYDSYKRLFKWLHRYFERVDDNRHRYFSLIALRWIKGESYAEMIGKQHSYRQESHKGNVKLATTIRGLLRNINQDLRFRYVKYTRCYVDVLTSALNESGFSHLRERIPPVSLFLELGASSRTMVNLIGLGLSRTSAGIIHECVHDVDMTREEVVEWLRETDLTRRSVPDLCVEEVREVLG